MATEPQSNLLTAIKLGEPSMVDWAVENGADVNAPDEAGATPLMLSVIWGMSEMAARLVSNGAAVDCVLRGYTPLMVAAQEGQLESARVLTTAGADIEVRNEHGLTALMAAAQHGHVEIVRLLLDAGADRHATTNSGSTALDAARRFGHTTVIELLEQPVGASARKSLGPELAGRVCVWQSEGAHQTEDGGVAR